MELSRQEMEFFTPFQSLDQKTSLTDVSPFGPTIQSQEMELSKQEIDVNLGKQSKLR